MKKIFTLNGGEQQRVAIARVILQNPKAILVDEPTFSLDEKNEKYIMNTLKSMNEKGTTVIMVTHNPNLEKYSSRTINISKFTS